MAGWVHDRNTVVPLTEGLRLNGGLVTGLEAADAVTLLALKHAASPLPLRQRARSAVEGVSVNVTAEAIEPAAATVDAVDLAVGALGVFPHDAAATITAMPASAWNERPGIDD